MHRAGAAKGFATAELASRQSKFVPKIPKQRHFRIAIELPADTIHFQGNHYQPPHFDYLYFCYASNWREASGIIGARIPVMSTDKCLKAPWREI
jgi:hypothetical protein